MRIARREQPAPQALKLRMGDDTLDEPLRQSSATIVRQDENVGKVGQRRTVRDYAGEADLPIAVQEREAERVLK